MNTQDYYNYYLETKSIVRVSKKFHVCTKDLKKKFLKEGFEYPIKSFLYQVEYSRNYFETIDTYNKAYFLGFIFADGCLFSKKRKKGTSHIIRINIAKKDKEILEAFRKEIGYKKDLKILKGKKFISPNGKEYTRQDQVCLVLDSYEMFTHLENFGLGNRKTYSDLSIPDIDRKYIPAFLRGYFDGDGCIYTGESTDRNGYINKIAYVLFDSKTENILLKIKNHLDYMNIFSGISYTSRKSFRLTISGYINCRSFFSYIYSYTGVGLKRKFQKFCRLKTPLKGESPEVGNSLLKQVVKPVNV